MVLGKLQVPGRPTIWMIVGRGPIALAVGVGWGLFEHFYFLKVVICGKYKNLNKITKINISP